MAQRGPAASAEASAPKAAGGGTLLSREEARALADRVLKLSTADETRVNITSEWSGNTRFANASITTSGGVANVSVRVTATVGRRRASATTNVLDDAVVETHRRSGDLAGAPLARGPRADAGARTTGLSVDSCLRRPHGGPRSRSAQCRGQTRRGRGDGGGEAGGRCLQLRAISRRTRMRSPWRPARVCSRTTRTRMPPSR